VSIPSVWEFALGALAVFRIYRLIAEDEIAQRPRDWAADWIEDHLDRDLTVLITCPWCLGTYLTLAAWGFWLLAPTAATFLAAPLAFMAIVALISKFDHRL